MKAMNRYTNRDSITESLWQSATMTHHRTILPTKKYYDTLIIGGGITGITTALLLQKSGQACILAEKNTLGFGTTGGTTAHLNTFFDATYPQIERDFGEEAAKLVAQSGVESLNMIKQFVDEYGINCDFEYKDGYLFSQNEDESKALMEIFEASKKAGVAVSETDENGLPIPFEKAIKFKQQAQFHPLHYINALADEFIRIGGVIVEHTFIKKTDYGAGMHSVQSEKFTIVASNLVYATHIPPGINTFSVKCAPYRSYVLGLSLANEDYPQALSYDMLDAYHYFRTHVIDGKPYLLIGGEDHKTGHGNPQHSFLSLEQYAKRYFDIVSIDYRWSAQYYVPIDGLPYIGLLPHSNPNTFLATGFNGNGMVFGTLSSKIISDLILQKKNSYALLFDPGRIKPIAGFASLVAENADVAWHFIADRFSKTATSAISELRPCQGKLIEVHGRQLAIYKNEKGEITALNPRCTHAGCTVKFNDVEQSWDCPCHGGRYDITGKVLTGPPLKDLESINIS